jgi:hypothetical protein
VGVAIPGLQEETPMAFLENVVAIFLSDARIGAATEANICFFMLPRFRGGLAVFPWARPVTGPAMAPE